MKYLSRKDLMSKIQLLDNAQDKFIIVGAFNGLLGNLNEDLCNIKIKDIDFVNDTILVGGKKIKINDEMMKIAKDAIKQTIYTSLSVKGANTQEYLLNTNSEYVIRVKPNSKTKNGTTPLTVGGLRTRIKDLTTILGIEDMNSRKLKQSGAFALLKEDGRDWTTRGAQEFLKEKGFNLKINIVLKMIQELKKEQWEE